MFAGLTLKATVLGAMVALASGMAHADNRILKVGHGLGPDSHPGAAAAALADVVSSKLGDKFTIETFPNFALGDERQMIEGTVIGTVDIAIVSTGPLGNFVPETTVFDLPFLFDDAAEARAVLDGPVGQKLLDKCAPRGFVCLAWSENGVRHLTNNKRPVASLDDIEGLKVRTMENDVHMASFSAMGALPVAISGSEIYTALQQHVVDGQENPLGNIGVQNLFQVQKYLTLTGHFYSPHVVIVAGGLWGDLDDSEKEIFKEAARAAAAAGRKRVDELNEEWLTRLQEEGMEVTELTPEHKAELIKAVQPVYEEWAKNNDPALLEEIRQSE